jgi:hypothetical protein
MKDMKEDIARGLRAMKNPPDYFLFCDGNVGDWTWDEPAVCGIPVLHGWLVHNTFNDWGIPWIPVWKDQCDWEDVSSFYKAYDQ